MMDLEDFCCDLVCGSGFCVSGFTACKALNMDHMDWMLGVFANSGCRLVLVVHLRDDECRSSTKK